MLQKIIKKLTIVGLFLSVSFSQAKAQNGGLADEAEQAMLRATRFMVDEVSTNGGFVWYYLPDLSRRWGEMEAYETMIWMQGRGTVSMGNLFLDAYRATGDEFYYEAAENVAAAVIWGQGNEGGWNYMVDFAGDRSLKQWYNTIGKNAWRLEEFQHYYGNSTFDDNVTTGTARFLLRMYLEKLDPAYKPALEKAIGYLLKSQYPSGGWPQRYPLRYDFGKNGNPDYTSFYTFNDGVIERNIEFLIQCYLTLGEERFLEPVRRGMNFYLVSQYAGGGWAQQLDMDLQVAGARTYEPEALLPKTTFENALTLLKFYRYTGDKKFLDRVPDAIAWLEELSLPENKTEGGRFTHPTFVEPETNRAIYVHRKGSNVKYGYYYSDDSDDNLLGHYGGKCRLDLEQLKEEYKRLAALKSEEATEDSPLKPGKFSGEITPQQFYFSNRNWKTKQPDVEQVMEIIDALDDKSRWLVKHVMISNPYTGNGQKQELTDDYASTYVGDKTDTSPFRDTSEQLYISTGEYVKNMSLLIDYIETAKESPQTDLIEPYERSDYMTAVTFDWSTLTESAPGSDIWPITWSDDGDQYTVWGDGGGFGGDNKLGRVPLGVARISGDWDNYEGKNIWGGHQPVKPSTFGGKSWGIISVEGVLYMWWSGDDSDRNLTKWGDNSAINECRIAVSYDHGESWTLSEKMFDRYDLLCCPTFLNFGKDNGGARDKYVYSYFPRLNNSGEMWYDSNKVPQKRKPGKVDLARVPKSKITDREAYEFFSGFDAGGNPRWTRDFSPDARKPVYIDQTGGIRTVACTYNPGLQRYLFTTEHTRVGKSNLGTIGIFEAKEPWGPWKTVYYSDNFGMEPGGPERLIGNLNFYFAPKWFSRNGKEFTIVTSADGDNWGSIRGEFTIKKSKK